MKITQSAALTAMAFAFFTQSVQAQSLRDFDNSSHSQSRSDVRAAVSVTIPLGGRRGSDETKRRVDFTLQSERLGHSQSVTPLRFDPDFQRQRGPSAAVSFTLEQNPQMLMNGQRIATFGPSLTADEDESSGGGAGETVLYIVGGVLVLGVIGTVALTTDIRDAVSDAIGPAD